jgi:hypothetical protein
VPLLGTCSPVSRNPSTFALGNVTSRPSRSNSRAAGSFVTLDTLNGSAVRRIPPPSRMTTSPKRSTRVSHRSRHAMKSSRSNARPLGELARNSVNSA